MTVAEADAVNKLCRYILGRAPYDQDGGVPPDHQVLGALVHLTERAHLRLLAGFSAKRVRELWPQRPGGLSAVAEWLHENPERAVDIVSNLHAARAWEESHGVWYRWPLVPNEDGEALVKVRPCLDAGDWRLEVEFLHVESDHDYATADEARAAADQVLVEDGYALVGGVHS